MYEMLVGLEVTDDEIYQAYRKAMLPLLTAYAGSFGYDFKISEVLKAEVDEHINRVFTIKFPSEQQMQQFFSAPEYLAVKARYFDLSVKSSTIMARYNREHSNEGG